MPVTIEHAEAAIRPARKEATERGTQMCVAAVDPGGDPEAFGRMDGVRAGAIAIGRKAGTASSFGTTAGRLPRPAGTNG